MLKRLACGVLLLASGLFSTGCCLTERGVCDAGAGCDSCGAGCGDVYFGEWTSDPPSCGGPCDSCGVTDCGGCGGCWNPLQGLAPLWGYRYAPGGYGMGYDMGYDEGCESSQEFLRHGHAGQGADRGANPGGG